MEIFAEKYANFAVYKSQVELLIIERVKLNVIMMKLENQNKRLFELNFFKSRYSWIAEQLKDSSEEMRLVYKELKQLDEPEEKENENATKEEKESNDHHLLNSTLGEISEIGEEEQTIINEIQTLKHDFLVMQDLAIQKKKEIFDMKENVNSLKFVAKLLYLLNNSNEDSCNSVTTEAKDDNNNVLLSNGHEDREDKHIVNHFRDIVIIVSGESG